MNTGIPGIIISVGRSTMKHFESKPVSNQGASAEYQIGEQASIKSGDNGRDNNPHNTNEMGTRPVNCLVKSSCIQFTADKIDQLQVDVAPWCYVYMCNAKQGLEQKP